MNKLEIRTPIWKYPRSIGIAASKLTGHQLEIEISYKDKEGVKLYPERYYVDCESARKYPSQIVKGIKLYIIPIHELGIVGVECSEVEQPVNIEEPKRSTKEFFKAQMAECKEKINAGLGK